MTLGFEAAARAMGADVTGLAVEANPSIAAVFAANFPGTSTVASAVEDLIDGECGDAATPTEDRLSRTFGQPDVLMGGPPCQGHSDLNNHTRRTDSRNQLYLRMARAAEILDPRVVVVENVPAVLHDKSGVVQETIGVLEKRGYQVAQDIIEMRHLGVPQARRRHVVIGSRCDVDPREVLELLASLKVDGRTVRWAIEDLVDLPDESREPIDVPARRSPENQRRMRYLFEHDLYNLPNELRPVCHRDKEHSYNAVYGRLRWDDPAPTVTTGFTSMGQGRYVHPARQRTLTAHEAARLQSFPDWFDWHTKSRTLLSTMIGNAVPPLLMARLATLMLPDLLSNDANSQATTQELRERHR